MRTIGVLSQKGGTGKTTLAVNLAAELSRRPGRTLLLDCDPQASGSRWYDRREAIVGTSGALCGRLDVSDAHAGRIGATLRRAELDRYRYAVIDTPPQSGAAAMVADACDLILIPCRPSMLDMDAIESTIRAARFAGRPFAIVLNAVPASARRLLDEIRDGLRKRGAVIADTIVGDRAAFRHSMAAGRAVLEWRGATMAQGEAVNLAAEAVKRIVVADRAA